MDATPTAAERAVRQFLIDRYGRGVTEVAAIGAGDWSRAYAFRLDGRDLVVRFGRYRADFEKDRMAAAFGSPDLPVPEVLEIGEADQGCYAISEKRFGTFLEGLGEAGWRAILPALLRGTNALRQTAPPGSGVDWAAQENTAPVGWREWLLQSLEDRPGARVSGWRHRLPDQPEADETFGAGLRALAGLLPACPEIRHVIHRDLINRNVLVSADALRLEAVFDWGCSVAGDFLYEVAWFTFWQPWYPALERLDLRMAFHQHYRTMGAELSEFDQRLACYELHIGLENIAYAAFTGRADHQHAVVRRTRRALAALTKLR